MRKFRSAIALLLCAVLLCACGDKTHPTTPTQSDPATTGTAPSLSAEMTYTVTVVDANGEPVSGGVVVTFLSGETEAAMQMVNEAGVAEKVLPTGTYTVELGFTDTSMSHHYITDDLTLTPQKTALTVVLSQALSDNALSISAYSEAVGDHKSYDAHFISAGSTYVPLDTTDRTYVLFMPAESGLYLFSVMDSNAAIGYYGSQHFVQQQSIVEHAADGSFTVNISNGMIGTGETGTSILVLGLDAADGTDCIVTIERIGDPELTIEDLPWDIYQTTAALSAFTLPDSVTVCDFDLTAASDTYNLVKGTDGLYHVNTADGPVVYARLGCTSAYLDSIEAVLERSGISRYYYDENGTCVSKESYTECLLEYLQYMDEVSGLYPLTDDLIFIFQSRGEYVGWWDKNSASYLFKDANGNPVPGINADIAWMFLLCYGETNPDDPCAAGHTEVTDVAKAATCTKDGLTEGKHCQVCGKVTVQQEKVPATGHSFGDWKETKAPTVDSEGTAERKCSVCGKTEQKKLDKLESTDPGPSDDPDPVPVPEKVVGTPANEDAPVELGGELAISFDATVEAGEYIIHNLYRVSGTYLTIHDEYAYVVYNGKTYWPENGVISVYITSDGPSVPMEVWIGNYSFEQRTIHVDCLYPVGTMMNPDNLSLGTFTTVVPAGDEQGYYYTFVADAKGYLTITLDSLDVDANCAITLYNLDSYANVSMEGNTVTVKCKAGQTVQVIIGIFTDDYAYPGGTVVATATFE